MKEYNVNLNLPAQLIVQCYDMIDSIRGIDIDELLTPSEAVHEVLTNLMNRLARSGKVPVASEKTVEYRMEAILALLEPDPSDSHNESEDGIDDIISGLFGDQVEDDDKDKSNEAAEVAATVQGVSFDNDPPVKPDIQNRSDDERILDEHAQAVKLGKPPWEMDNIRPFQDLEILAPKDALIEAASMQGDEVSKRAIECIYSNIPMEMWGTETAQRLVADLKPEIEIFLSIPNSTSDEPNEPNEQE